MTREPIAIIWHYLILFTLFLELVILNLNVMKAHTDFSETGAVLYRICDLSKS